MVLLPHRANHKLSVRLDQGEAQHAVFAVGQGAAAAAFQARGVAYKRAGRSTRSGSTPAQHTVHAWADGCWHALLFYNDSDNVLVSVTGVQLLLLLLLWCCSARRT